MAEDLLGYEQLMQDAQCVVLGGGRCRDAEPELAELSFKYKIVDADAAVENRALKLFLALQELPPKWTSPEHQTKTEVGLPDKCSRH